MKKFIHKEKNGPAKENLISKQVGMKKFATETARPKKI